MLSQSQHVFGSQSLKFSPKLQSHIYWLQLSLCRRSVHLFDTLGLNQTAAEDAPEISLSFVSGLLEFVLKCLVDTVAQGRCGWTLDKWRRKQFKLSGVMMSHSRAVQTCLTNILSLFLYIYYYHRIMSCNNTHSVLSLASNLITEHPEIIWCFAVDGASADVVPELLR